MGLLFGRLLFDFMHQQMLREHAPLSTFPRGPLAQSWYQNNSDKFEDAVIS